MASAMIENFESQIRQFLPHHCLSPVPLGDFLRKKAFSRNPEITVRYGSGAGMVATNDLGAAKNAEPSGSSHEKSGSRYRDRQGFSSLKRLQIACDEPLVTMGLQHDSFSSSRTA